VIAGSVATMLGVYMMVFRPLLALVDAMKRFGAGDRDARADPALGIDLAGAATTFNDMAEIITGQHARMLDFLGRVSQDLRSSVEVMRAAMVERGPGKAPGGEDKARQRSLTVAREVDRLDRIVDGFLDTSRLEWQRLDLQLGTQDFGALVGEIVGVYETFATHHHLSVALPERPALVSFDQGRISQVVHALLANAIQAAPAGGVVELTVTADAEEAILTVRDHGGGMSREEIDKLFEPFHVVATLEAARRNVNPGTFVALSVARRIVEAHGGRLEVESARGAGSTFRVRLPVAQKDLDQGRTVAARPRVALANRM
jgi:signal transduction histidine kinase